MPHRRKQTHRHLNDTVQRVHTIERAALDGHADNGQGGHRRNHARQMCCTARPCDNRAQPPRGRGARVLDEAVGRAVCGDDGELVRDLELVEDARGREHDGQVRVGAHDDAHERVRAGESGPGRLRCGRVQIGLGDRAGRERFEQDAEAGAERGI